MIFSEPGTLEDRPAVDRRVTLSRHGAPLLYAHEASTFTDRLLGVHKRPRIGPTDALIIRPCKAIHTMGLEYPIDVMFLDRRGIILKLERVLPGNVSFCLWGRVAVEMCSGTVNRLGLTTGQQFARSTGRW